MSDSRRYLENIVADNVVVMAWKAFNSDNFSIFAKARKGQLTLQRPYKENKH